MEEMSKADEKINTFVKVWQLITGMGGIVVIIVVFAISLKGEVAQNRKDIERHDKTIQTNQDKSEINQNKILDKLKDIELQLKDKSDRNK